MSDALRVMIVDDEAPAREGLRLRLRQEPNVTTVGEFADVARALDAIRIDVPDVLLLDIEMPALNGFALLDQLGDARPIVIFVTAHEAHAVRAFGVRALDYVLKPVEQERLHAALSHARDHVAMLRKGELADRMQRLVHDLDRPTMPAASRTNERISVRENGVIRLIELREIDWVEAAGDAVRVHVGRHRHLVRKSLGEMASLLPADRFLRIHRSTIVNVSRVRELQPWFHGEYVVILHDGTNLKLSRTHRDALPRLTG
jgi:two-component system LytT family response regulator